MSFPCDRWGLWVFGCLGLLVGINTLSVTPNGADISFLCPDGCVCVGADLA